MVVPQSYTIINKEGTIYTLFADVIANVPDSSKTVGIKILIRDDDICVSLVEEP